MDDPDFCNGCEPGAKCARAEAADRRIEMRAATEAAAGFRFACLMFGHDTSHLTLNDIERIMQLPSYEVLDGKVMAPRVN